MDAVTFSALAEPNRLRIVELLREGPRPVGEIAAQLRIRQPQVSKHLRVLSEAGLVEVRPVAQQRVYQLQATKFEALDTWLDSFRRLWERRLDAMDELVRELQSARQPKEANTAEDA
jgi:DNA-binding transcriptional ArsR family regulator